jgi:KaiC/GvpD/RAD55 family RecA-like ATPase
VTAPDGWVETATGWSPTEAPTYQYLTSLTEAADRFIAEAQAGRRINVGIDVLDEQMRGISPGHLALIVGYAHSGKTLVAMHTVRHNRDQRVLWYTPDEPAVLVLTKLASATWGVPARELESRVRDADPWALNVLGRTIDEFPNLVIVDRPLTPKTLNHAYEEACDQWGDEPELAVIDYLDLLQVGDRSTSKAEYVKSFTTEHVVPTIVLHQTSRSAGSKGQRMAIDSGNYGGETVAMFQIGVWRKRNAILAELSDLEYRPNRSEWAEDRIEQLRHDLAIHQYTISVNLTKNKRPGGELVDEVELEVQLDTGVLTPLRRDELPNQYMRRRLRVVTDDPYHRYENGEAP